MWGSLTMPFEHSSFKMISRYIGKLYNVGIDVKLNLSLGTA